MDKGVPMCSWHGLVDFCNNSLRRFYSTLRVINRDAETTKAVIVGRGNRNHCHINGKHTAEKKGNLAENVWDVVSSVIPDRLSCWSTREERYMPEALSVFWATVQCLSHGNHVYNFHIFQFRRPFHQCSRQEPRLAARMGEYHPVTGLDYFHSILSGA